MLFHFSFTKSQNRKMQQVLSVEGVGNNWKGKDIQKECKRVNIVQILCTHVCKWKMIPVETTPGMGGGRIKENDGGGWNSTMMYLRYYKNFCKCQNVPPPSTQHNKKEKGLRDL
jgi:hypothetical protein